MQVLEFFRDMTEQDGWWIHTAGTLRGGRKVWAMATNGDEGSVNPKAGSKGQKDTIRRNLLLATSLDGSMRTVAMETTIRVVCQNTLSLALSKDLKGQVAVSHRSVFNPDLVKRTLGVQVDGFKLFMEKARELADTPVQLEEARDILNKVFKVEKTMTDLSWLGNLSGLGTQAMQTNRSVARVLDLFKGDGMGSELKSAKGTKWGLLNAVTEFVDHEMGRSQDTRLDAAWFGRGASIKQDAVELITTI